MDAALATALQAQTILPFVAVKIVFTGRTVRLVDGSATVVIGSETFTGSDDWMGSLFSLGEPSAGLAVEEKGLQLGFTGVSETALTALETARGAPVTIQLGTLNLATGLVIGTPLLLFVGTVETSSENIAPGSQSVTVDCVSALSRMLLGNEGARLNSAWQQSRFAGERGLEYTHGLPTARVPNGVFLGASDFSSSRGFVLQVQN